MNCPKCNCKMEEMLIFAPVHFKAYNCPKCGFNDQKLLEEDTPEMRQRLNSFCKEIEKYAKWG